MGSRLNSVGPTALILALGILIAACRGTRGPEDVALDYGRAVYTYDAHAIYRLVSAHDRAAKDEASVRAQVHAPKGFAHELVSELARYVSATPLETHIVGAHASVKLKFALPNANDPTIMTLARDWDEQRLDALTERERADIRRSLEDLAKRHRLPVVDGEESFELVKEAGGWRVVADWATAISLRFAVEPATSIPLEVSVTPDRVRATPGDSFVVTIHVRNTSRDEITTRVGHSMTPEPSAKFLALLQCPLFLPVRLKPGESREFVSEYLLLKDVPARMDDVEVTYRFGPSNAALTSRRAREGGRR